MKKTKKGLQPKKLQLSKKIISLLVGGTPQQAKTTDGPTCTWSFNGPGCKAWL